MDAPLVVQQTVNLQGFVLLREVDGRGQDGLGLLLLQGQLFDLVVEFHVEFFYAMVHFIDFVHLVLYGTLDSRLFD